MTRSAIAIGGILLALLVGAALFLFEGPEAPSEKPVRPSPPPARADSEPSVPASEPSVAGADPAGRSEVSSGPEAVVSSPRGTTGELEGRVVGPDGAPLAGASVALSWFDTDRAIEEEERESAQLAASRAAVTGDDGLFRFAGVVAGTGVFDVEARAAGRSVAVILDVGVPRGRVTDVGELVLHPEARVSGFVRDDRGQPLPGVDVRVEEPIELSALSDEEGRFSLGGLFRTGRYHLEAVAEGWVMTSAGTVEIDFASESELTDVTLVMTPERPLRGTVHDDSGRPVPGAWVWARPAVRDNFWRQQTAQADEEGRYVLGGFPGDKSLRVWARALGHRQASIEGVTSGDEEVDFELTAIEYTEVILIGEASGEELTGFEAALERLDEEDEEFYAHDAASWELVSGHRALARPESGTYRIWASKWGYGAATSNIFEVSATAPPPPQIVLYVEPFPLHTGVVLDPGHEPVAGARVQLLRQLEGEESWWVPYGVHVFRGFSDEEEVRTDRQGRFGLTGRPPEMLQPEAGGYAVRVDAPGHPVLQRTISPDELLQPFELVLARGGAIAGRLLDAAGGGVPRRPVVAHRADGVFGFDFADDVGEFELAGLPPGQYRVESGDLNRGQREENWAVRDADEPTAAPPDPSRYPVTVREGQTTFVEVTSDGLDARLEVVVLRDGVPGRRLPIELYWKEGADGAARPGGVTDLVWGRTDDDGRFVARGLAPGEWGLSVWDFPYRNKLESAEVEITESGEELRIVVDLGSAVFTGVVRDGVTGQPLKGVRIDVERELTAAERRGGAVVTFQLRTTGADGRFRFADLEAGPWRVVVRATSGFSFQRFSVPLDVGETVDRTIALARAAGLAITSPSGEWPDGARVQVVSHDDQFVPWRPWGLVSETWEHPQLVPGRYRVELIGGENRGPDPFFEIEVELRSGETHRIEVPPDAWKSGSSNG